MTSNSHLPSRSSSYDYMSTSSHPRDAQASDSSDSYGGVSDDISSDDEIVLSFSDISAIGSPRAIARSQRAQSPGAFSDEDCVVLSLPARYQSLAVGRSTLTASGDICVNALSHALERVNLSQATERSTHKAKAPSPSSDTKASVPSSPSKRSKRRKAATTATTGAALAVLQSSGDIQASPTSSTTATSPSKKSKNKNKKKIAAAAAPGLVVKKAETAKPAKAAKVKPVTAVDSQGAGFGERPIVDDVSEVGDGSVVSGYDQAVEYVTSVLSDPAPKVTGNLTLLQALIIELGICPASPQNSNSSESLPQSMTSAKAILKSRVFINVRDYLAVRNKGLDALRSVMHPSRMALVKDIRAGGRKSRRVPVDWVKKSGLGVFLVTCYR